MLAGMGGGVKNAIKVRLKDKSGSKVLAVNEGDESKEGNLILSFSYTEAIGVYPYFSMEIKCNSSEFLFGLDDVTITYGSELREFESKACILEKNYKLGTGGIVRIVGKFAEKRLCLVADTVFLGETSKDAISALGFEQKIEVTKNVNARYFQKNQTALQALENICDCEADFPFWTIGIDKIILSKPSGEKDFIGPDKVKSFLENTLPDVEKVEEENYDEVFYSTRYNTQKAIGTIDTFEAIPGSIQNYYLRKNYKPYVILSGIYSQEYPYQVGQLMKNSFNEFKEISFWMVSATTFILDGTKPSTDIQLIYWKE